MESYYVGYAANAFITLTIIVILSLLGCAERRNKHLPHTVRAYDPHADETTTHSIVWKNIYGITKSAIFGSVEK